MLSWHSETRKQAKYIECANILACRKISCVYICLVDEIRLECDIEKQGEDKAEIRCLGSRAPGCLTKFDYI